MAQATKFIVQIMMNYHHLAIEKQEFCKNVQAILINKVPIEYLNL